jgi:hypothetical protein
MIKKINECDIFAINPNFKVCVHQLGDSKCVIVDDFYVNPEKIRELTLSIPASKSMIRNTYPGLSISLGINLTGLAETFVKLINENFNDGPRKTSNDIREAFNFMPFLVNVMQGQDQPTPHRDSANPGRFAASIYLNYNNESRGGTAFYSENGQELGYAEMMFNRLVLYRQTDVHTAVMQPDWFVGDSYRINQMMFI